MFKKFCCHKMIHFIVAVYNFVIIFRVIEVSSTLLCTKKIKLNKISKVKFNDKSKAVLMPHPNPRFKPSGHKELTLASKSLNINNISNKFKSIMKNLWRWSLNGKWIESK